MLPSAGGTVSAPPLITLPTGAVTIKSIWQMLHPICLNTTSPEMSILEDRVDEKNRSYVVDVKEEVELMSKLVGELLAYSKAGIKTTEVNLVKIPLRPLVETVIEREKATETAEVEIIIADHIEVLAQPELLSRAIANVVRNAVRYAGEAGEIKVSATNGKNQVKIEIADNGAGVPEDALEKLFDPFYRVESDRAAERRNRSGFGDRQNLHRSVSRESLGEQSNSARFSGNHFLEKLECESVYKKNK